MLNVNSESFLLVLITLSFTAQITFATVGYCPNLTSNFWAGKDMCYREFGNYRSIKVTGGQLLLNEQHIYKANNTAKVVIQSRLLQHASKSMVRENVVDFYITTRGAINTSGSIIHCQFVKTTDSECYNNKFVVLEHIAKEMRRTKHNLNKNRAFTLSDVSVKNVTILEVMKFNKNFLCMVSMHLMDQAMTTIKNVLVFLTNSSYEVMRTTMIWSLNKTFSYMKKIIRYILIALFRYSIRVFKFLADYFQQAYFEEMDNNP